MSIFKRVALLLAAFAVVACSAKKFGGEGGVQGKSAGEAVREDTPAPVEESAADAFEALEALAARERAAGYVPGMGLEESTLRERQGDYGGAVLAAFKELLQLYGMGVLPQPELAARLDAVEAAFPGNDDVAAAAAAARAYLEGEWAEVLPAAKVLAAAAAAPDDFAPWLVAACELELDPSDRSAGGRYAAARGRYAQSPAYWHHAARIGRGAAAMEAAEWCVSLSPSGPYAASARTILARESGLKPGDGPVLRTRLEIEAALSGLAAGGGDDAALLSELIPLLALPDNPYTLYALGGLRALCADGRIRTVVASARSRSSGRAAERLRYAAGAAP